MSTLEVDLHGSVTAEWIKLWSVRSTRILVFATAAVIVAFGVAAAVGIVVTGTATADGLADPLGACLTGIGPAQLLVLGIGVLTVTGEYASGTIAGTLTAQPRRSAVAFAKTLAPAIVVLVVAAIAVATTFTANAFVLSGRTDAPSITRPGVLGALLGAVVCLALVTMLGTAMGQLVRSTASALVLGVCVLYLPGLLVLALPRDVGAAASPYTPANAAAALMQVGPSDLLSWPLALVVLAAYVAVLSAWGAARLRRRDV